MHSVASTFYVAAYSFAGSIQSQHQQVVIWFATVELDELLAESIHYSNNVMLTSSIYVPRIDHSVRELQTNKFQLVQILGAKLLVILALFICPGIMQEDYASYVLTLLVAFEFWMTKNIGRKLLHASWSVDSSTGEDRWVFEATLASPKQIYQATFWYSCMLNGMLLLVFLCLSIYLNKMSMACAVAIGFGANFVNFWAFSKIIKLRNNGTLQGIARSVVPGEQVMDMTVKLPLLTNKPRKAQQ